MNVLKHFEFFRVEMTQQASSFDIQSMPDDADGVLRANLSGVIGPGQMIGIDRVPALRVDHQRLRSIGQDKVLGVGIQGAFITSDRHFFAPDPEQRDGDIVENRFFFLFKEASMLSIDLPLHLIAFGLGKREF